MEPVADGGKDGHSLFAYYFLKALKENDREVIDLENLFHTRVWKPVTEIGRQRPNVGCLQTPMDDDGQFVLTNLAAARVRTGKNEAEKAKSAMARRSTQVASLFTPAPEAQGPKPLKIALMPWKINPAGYAKNIKVSVVYKRVLQAVSEKDLFSVSHSYYDFDPPAETAEDQIMPLNISRKEADALWQKANLFSRSEPNLDATLTLSQKVGFDLALFIDCFQVGNEHALALTVVDAESKKAYTTKKDFYYLTYEELIQTTLYDQLKQVLEGKRS